MREKSRGKRYCYNRGHLFGGNLPVTFDFYLASDYDALEIELDRTNKIFLSIYAAVASLIGYIEGKALAKGEPLISLEDWNCPYMQRLVKEYRKAASTLANKEDDE